MTFVKTNATWEPPQELQRSTPREVEWTGAGMAAAAGAVALVVAAFVGAILLVNLAQKDAARWEERKADAQLVEGRVDGLRRRSSGKSTSYSVNYSYCAGQQSYAATARIPSRDWEGLRRGAPIDVWYLRSQPEVSWVRGSEPKGVPRWLPLALAPAVLLPAWLLAWQLGRQRRLLEEGRPALARITEVKKIRGQHGTMYRGKYEYETFAGQKRSGRWDATRAPVVEGQEFTVLYLPDEEKRSARYPLPLVRVRRS